MYFAEHAGDKAQFNRNARIGRKSLQADGMLQFLAIKSPTTAEQVGLRRRGPVTISGQAWHK